MTPDEVTKLIERLRAMLPAYESWMDKHGDDVQSAVYRPHTFGQLRQAHKDLDALQSLTESGKGTGPWKFCPECGSEDIRYEEGGHKQCAKCGQEWFADINYLDVVANNLRRLFATPSPPVAPQRPWKFAPEDIPVMPEDDSPVPVVFRTASEIEQERLAATQRAYDELWNKPEMADPPPHQSLEDYCNDIPYRGQWVVPGVVIRLIERARAEVSISTEQAELVGFLRARFGERMTVTKHNANMVERLAKVIGDHYEGHVDPAETPQTWASAVACARSAIEAMREPTYGMVSASGREIDNTNFMGMDLRERRQAMYSAMIDAALDTTGKAVE